MRCIVASPAHSHSRRSLRAPRSPRSHTDRTRLVYTLGAEDDSDLLELSAREERDRAPSLAAKCPRFSFPRREGAHVVDDASPIERRQPQRVLLLILVLIGVLLLSRLASSSSHVV